MSLVILLLILATCIFAVACVTLRSKNKSFEGMICKFMASFGFISIAIMGNYINGNNVKYFSFILFGLLFGFCGDVFLGIKEIAPSFKRRLIPVGTVYFLIGHLLFMFAFISLQGMNWITIIALPFGICLSLVISKLLKMQLQKPLLAVLSVYYGMLIWKVAFTGWIVFKDPCMANIFALIGSVFFLISDTCLAILYFTPVKKKNGLVTAELSTYYPAQILLAMSVLFR